jgi:hypothetical protein
MDAHGSGSWLLDTDYYHDRFVVTSIDGDHLHLFDLSTHITWMVMRIPLDFAFPTPAPCVNS